MATDDGTLAEEVHVREKASGSAPREPPAVLCSPGSICGRIRANPLKHLAYLLREKLRAAHGGPCNLLQVAAEIHSQAEDKHNTTLRRIYDVVNVCEGAGVIARTGQRSPKSKKTPASDQNVLPSRCCPYRRAGKRRLGSGAEIQWLGGSSPNTLGESAPQISCKNYKLLLETEKGETVDRILQKKRTCDTLSKQVAILQKLLEQNQAQCRHLYQYACRKMSGEEVQFSSNSCMPRSTEAGSSSSESWLGKISPDFDIYTDLACLQSLEGYCGVNDLNCEYIVDQQRLFTAKHLHLPFVMLATNPDANVDIFMTGDPSYEVRLELDHNYCLMDHIQMIKMLPDGRVYKHQ